MSKEKSFAVISTGGKQYKVAPGDYISVEKISGQPGDEVELDQVLLVEDSEKGTTVGAPLVKGAAVKAKIISFDKDKKKIIFKKIRRKGYKNKMGHRQKITRLLVESISV